MDPPLSQERGLNMTTVPCVLSSKCQEHRLKAQKSVLEKQELRDYYQPCVLMVFCECHMLDKPWTSCPGWEDGACFLQAPG